MKKIYIFNITLGLSIGLFGCHRNSKSSMKSIFKLFSNSSKDSNIDSNESSLIAKNSQNKPSLNGINDEKEEEIRVNSAKKYKNNSSIKLEEILKAIKRVQPGLEPAKNKEEIILLGNTGSGKSTFSNYLKGLEMYKIPKTEYDPISKEYLQIPGKYLILVKNKKKKIAKIGHSSISKTFFPEVFEFEDSLNKKSLKDLIICDCPGNRDNRSKEKRSIIDILIYLATQYPKKIKTIICLIDYKDISGRATLFADTMENIDKMILLEKRNEIFKSLIFLFTKVPDFIKRKHLLAELGRIEKDVEEEMGYHSSHELTLKLVLLKNMLKNKHNIMIYNPVDKGQSRNYILNKIKSIQPIPKSYIRFDKDKSNQFMNILLEICFEGFNILKNCIVMPKQLEALKQNFEKELKIFDNKIYENENYKQELIKRKKQKLNEINSDLLKVEENIKNEQNGNINLKKQIEIEKKSIDKKIKRKKNDIKNSKSDYDKKDKELKEEQIKLNDFNKKIKKENEKIQKNTSKISSIGPTKISQNPYWKSPGFSEKDTYGDLKKGDCTTTTVVEYNDIPFVKYKVNKEDSGKYEVKNVDYDNGKLIISYTTGPNIYGHFQAKVYCIKGQILKFKKAIEELQKFINNSKENVQSYNTKKSEVLNKIENLKKEIEEESNSIKKMTEKINELNNKKQEIINLKGNDNKKLEEFIISSKRQKDIILKEKDFEENKFDSSIKENDGKKVKIKKEKEIFKREQDSEIKEITNKLEISKKKVTSKLKDFEFIKRLWGYLLRPGDKRIKIK